MAVPAQSRPDAKARQELIQSIIAEINCVPSTREMAKILNERGCRMSHVSVAADYKLLRVAAAKTFV
jgi:hypothetical protein